MATINELEEARSAYHKLLTGKAVVKLQKDGRQVEYTPSDRAMLQKYITELEMSLGQSTRRRGPAGVI